MMTRIQMMMARSRQETRRLKDDESGVLVAFGVFFVLTMLLLGGIGIDLMRFEYTRSALQGVLDRSVLAAADLDQQNTPETVVRDYFTKSNLDAYLKSVTVDQGLNYREVSATAEFEMNTQFMRMMGVDTLVAPAAGTAAESVDGVEISLVLDMSGSMGSNSKLDNLQDAAKEFVRTMINSSPPGDVAVSIVPYATQVNAGATLAQHFNLTNEHDFSHCVNFDSSDFHSTSISTTASLKRTGPFDPFDNYEHEIESRLALPVCPVRAGSEIMSFSGDVGDLEDYIDEFTADGNTSIDIGVKWGAALLDPAMRPVVNKMIADGDVSNSFTGMPADFNDDTLKVMVVMTDGQNTSQYYLKDGYRDGNTDVWFYEGNYNGNNYRIYSVKSGSYYYYKRAGNWSNSYQGYRDAYWLMGDKYSSRGTQPYGGSAAVRLTFPQLFNQASNDWIEDELYYDIWSSSYADQYWDDYGAYSWVSGSTKNNRLDDICTAAKEAGIIVYTIGFEAPWSGEAVLESCASSDAHFFDVDGLEIADAFVSIASSISKLRLIQ
ncbi:pilus assembly protein TadG-related protein [Rhodalgimonas zhirmunskyi]|uniref:Pilus assembly protein TadG-related protein n=1 Tax=Rhodalgimonas zhirmunskyi TaxID=2964767 RepID=A0AAJ1U590_9RHOB|nr:pilus assembly protein TadG-related protein [Rhodoalgimonas zhirmunskyi]MDQ2093269.1 pilus assembly protein TadG-related protein [Rhodoalgimonas zhirmunskyi]